MANGPPTPPPTTAAELQDAARGNPSDSPSFTTTTQTEHDSYEYIFPVIADFASQSSFHDLIRTAEGNDLNAEGDGTTTRLLVTAPLVLAYLIVDNLPPARYALTRLPDNLASTPLSKALTALLASTWSRKHANVYSRAEDLFNLVTQSDFNTTLASVIAGMVTTFVESFRQRTLVLLSKAYTTLPLPLARACLGMTADQLLATAKKAHWSYDTSTNILKPVPSAASAASSSPKQTSSSLTTFHLIADSVAKLEL